MRLGEVLGLEWQHVDFDEGSLNVEQQLTRKGKRSKLKTRRSRRWIEVTPALISRLRTAKMASPASTPP